MSKNFLSTFNTEHTFHIPVMGTAFTIDTPLKVAKFGISSVVSIVDDELCEEMRKKYSELYQLEFSPIEKFSDDYRAKRITAYLDMMDDIISHQVQQIKSQQFSEQDNDLNKYFELLPDFSVLKLKYKTMRLTSDESEKNRLQSLLKEAIAPGAIDVNIMTKLDRDNFTKNGEKLDAIYSDANASLRGFANSKIDAGIVLSAGFNRRLYAYFEQFSDFFPDKQGHLKKRIILKVSDYRSSLTQGKFLAKKGLWVSEHRVESGLNCGGHAFASEGFLLGPILEEFKKNRSDLVSSLLVTCNEALRKKDVSSFNEIPQLKITVQGGIGTANENDFLFSYYKVDNTGWASPFLLVPEVTTLDEKTRHLLSKSGKNDFYLSGISPLGVPFNTVRNTESELEKLKKVEDGKPGSPCPKGYLISNEEFSKKKVCTASMFYQKRKLAEIKALNLPAKALKEAVQKVIEKACLCEDLASPALLLNNIKNKRPLFSAICPGPNTAYFSKLSSLKDMVSHIYGRLNLLNAKIDRPNMFINELKMYIDYFQKEIAKHIAEPTKLKLTSLHNFRKNLEEGISYYKELFPNFLHETQKYREKTASELQELNEQFKEIVNKHQSIFTKINISVSKAV